MSSKLHLAASIIVSGSQTAEVEIWANDKYLGMLTIKSEHAAEVVGIINAGVELIAVCTEIEAWLIRLAKQCDQQAANNSFLTLVEANQADAKNYRAVASHIRTALARSEAKA